MPLFLLDIHRNISSADVLLKFDKCIDSFEDPDEDFISNASFIVGKNGICVEVCRESLPCNFNIVTPKGLINPSTVSLCCKNTPGCTLVHENNVTKINFIVQQPDIERKTTLEIAFQFQIPNIDIVEKYILRKRVQPVLLKDVMYDKYKSIEACRIICTNCGFLLTKNLIKFASVHKYYEGKSELEETSFCHKHDDHNATEVKANSLYIDDLYFYFHHSVLSYFKLLEKNKTYRCAKCSSTLSFQKKTDNLQYIGFFSDKIMLVKSQYDKKNFKGYKVETCLYGFYSLIQEFLKTTPSFKLYLQSKVDEKTDVLLLWVNSEKIVQYLTEGRYEMKMLPDYDFFGEEVYKVFYCLTLSDSELSKKWKHDFNVEFFQISDNMMSHIKRILRAYVRDSDYFTESEEFVKDFTFTYLPAEVPICKDKEE